MWPTSEAQSWIPPSESVTTMTGTPGQRSCNPRKNSSRSSHASGKAAITRSAAAPLSVRVHTSRNVHVRLLHGAERAPGRASDSAAPPTHHPPRSRLEAAWSPLSRWPERPRCFGGALRLSSRPRPLPPRRAMRWRRSCRASAPPLSDSGRRLAISHENTRRRGSVCKDRPLMSHRRAKPGPRVPCTASPRRSGVPSNLRSLVLRTLPCYILPSPHCSRTQLANNAVSRPTLEGGGLERIRCCRYAVTPHPSWRMGTRSARHPVSSRCRREWLLVR